MSQERRNTPLLAAGFERRSADLAGVIAMRKSLKGGVDVHFPHALKSKRLHPRTDVPRTVLCACRRPADDRKLKGMLPKAQQVFVHTQ